MNSIFPIPYPIQTWQGSAEFEDSPIGRLRWRLDRWQRPGPRVLVVMANPSSAGGDMDDPTIRSLKRLLPDCNGFTVVNWYPYISTDPEDLHAWRNREAWTESFQFIERANISMIRSLSITAAQRIVAYGNLVPAIRNTHRTLLALSNDLQFPLYAFGETRHGAPIHPQARGRMRIATGTVPVIWREAKHG